MSFHAEMMRDLRMNRNDYLKAIRRQQPIAELERKANKARSRNGWTQEELDLGAAKSVVILCGILWE